MNTNNVIMVVDDEPDIQNVLNDYLSGRGFQVILAQDGDSMREKLTQTIPHIVLLDINLPGEDGLSLARFLRSQNYHMGIIMITGQGDVIDRVLGLEMGADDYVAKPFDLRELQARINSVLRRYQHNDDNDTAEAVKVLPAENTVKFGHCTLNTNMQQLMGSDGVEIAISTQDFELLYMFVTRPNRILSRDQILEYTQNRNWDPYDRSIDIRIARLRKKIEPDNSKPRFIKTVRGAGYIYIPID